MSVLRHVPFILRTAALVMIIIAIARPRSSTKMDKIDTEGIDIVLAMDVSTSMLARDFTPDRISAAKDIAIEFISQRPSDRMGIVVFAGESYTQCPLTTDRATLINLMKEIMHLVETHANRFLGGTFPLIFAPKTGVYLTPGAFCFIISITTKTAE